MLGTVAFEKLSTEDFKWLQSWLKDCSAIVLEDGRKFVAEKRLHGLLWKHKVTTFKDLCHYLRQGTHHDLTADAIEAMTANETWFFRDPAYFELLRCSVLPGLIKARQESRQLRLWSAGCSSGQEAYSVAMLLKGLPELAGWDVTLFASDLSQRQIDRARRGIYTREEVNRGLPASMLTQYFQQDGIVWTAKEELRSRVQFQTLSLHEPWAPMPAFDLILLRNVLFYFDESTRLELLWRMRKQLAGDGCLMLGGLEKSDLLEGYELNGNEKSWVYRRTQWAPVAKAA
jgi:chemotaxis protein methyltransferase CheR